MKKITFIINPISGTGKKDQIPKLIDQILDPQKAKYEIIYTEYAGHAKEISAKKASEGVDVVVAVGGDGTVNEVASSLVHTHTALGILPCGSGNGLARHLGVPLRQAEAIALLQNGDEHIIDYGKINKERLFFCSCGVGFDALVSWKFAQASTRGLLTYCQIAIKENFSYKAETYKLTADTGETLEDKAFVIAFGNAAQYGNDAFIAPHASIQDGVLDVTLIKPISLYDTPILSYQLFAGTIDKNKKTRTLKCREVTLEREKEGPMHYDGEPFMAPKDLTIEIIKGGLKVITHPKKKI